MRSHLPCSVSFGNWRRPLRVHPAGAAPWVFIAAAIFQALAIAAMLVGRNARVQVEIRQMIFLPFMLK